MESDGFDVIGDVHGMGGQLERLLRHLGYDDSDGAFHHPSRRVILVGDLVDRGPEQVKAIRIVQAMMERGRAFCVMGNHEFNAIAFHTPDPSDPGEMLRPNTATRLHQHGTFLDQVGHGSALHSELVGWFRTLPLWLELDGLRVVHACWDEASMALLPDGPVLTDSVLTEGTRRGTPEHGAIEVLLKSPEIPIDPPYLDQNGTRRQDARFAWWRSNATTIAEAVEVPGSARGLDGDPWTFTDPGQPFGESPIDAYPADAPPVFFGHYWRSGQPRVEGSNTACVDYSACKGGPLVAYRWSGEQSLTDDNLTWAT